MQFIKNYKIFLILILLLFITLLSWLLSNSLLFQGQLLGVSILAFAFIKVRLIIMHYMEANTVKLPIRLAFEAWILIAGLGTIILYL
jgi:hypothetical protein